jgi:hypothetical protein
MSCISITKLCVPGGTCDQLRAGETAVAPPAYLGGRIPPSSKAGEFISICGGGAGAVGGAAAGVWAIKGRVKTAATSEETSRAVLGVLIGRYLPSIAVDALPAATSCPVAAVVESISVEVKC